jgi:hypothetical protein
MGGIITAMIVIGLGTGGIKANVTPMCAEQYKNTKPVLKTLKSGEHVLVDPEMTIQRMFMWFYWVVNIGALSPLITVNVEARNSFWLAFLIPLLAFLITTAVFLSGHRKYVKMPPTGSAILDAMRVTGMAIREKGFDKVAPAQLALAGKLDKYSFTSKPQYNEEYVGEVKRGVQACKVFSPSLGPQDTETNPSYRRCLSSFPFTSSAGFRYGTISSARPARWLYTARPTTSSKTLTQLRSSYSSPSSIWACIPCSANYTSTSTPSAESLSASCW